MCPLCICDGMTLFWCYLAATALHPHTVMKTLFIWPAVRSRAAEITADSFRTTRIKAEGPRRCWGAELDVFMKPVSSPPALYMMMSLLTCNSHETFLKVNLPWRVHHLSVYSRALSFWQYNFILSCVIQGACVTQLCVLCNPPIYIFHWIFLWSLSNWPFMCFVSFASHVCSEPVRCHGWRNTGRWTQVCSTDRTQ